jgi:esterase/lipase superfamily enzyme
MKKPFVQVSSVCLLAMLLVLMTGCGKKEEGAMEEETPMTDTMTDVTEPMDTGMTEPMDTSMTTDMPEPIGTDMEEPNLSATPVPTGARMVDKTLRFVRLFFGTNRARTAPCIQVATTRWDAPDSCRPNTYYGGVVAEMASDTLGLEVGTLAVTFPPHHVRGKIERPLKVFTVSLRDEKPSRDVVISELQSFGTDHAAWVGELRATGRDQAFIYVHGFETSFAEAARQAAQIAYDLDFDLKEDFRGVPMLFSWPSRGGVKAYGLDYDASFESIDAFNRFLDLVKKQAGIRRVHIIAHSMGNRVVTEALYARQEWAEPLVDQLVLAAPDVWASRFKNHFLHTLPRLAARVTLYVSDQDRALKASSGIREGEPRAGEVAGGLLEASRGVERFDAINASTLPTDFLGHSYYANSDSMLSDIYCLLKGAPAAGRPLLALVGASWQFRPAKVLAALDASACLATAVSQSPQATEFPWLPVAVAVLLGTALLVLVLRWRRR